MIQESTKIEWRESLVQFLMCVRREYLQTSGCSPLKHWDQMQTRLRLAARTSETLEELVSTLLRKLQILAPGQPLCKAISSLRSAVATGETPPFLAMVEAEEGYLWACVRLEAERRKAEVVAALETKKKVKNAADLTAEQRAKIEQALASEFAQDLVAEIETDAN